MQGEKVRIVNTQVLWEAAAILMLKNPILSSPSLGAAVEFFRAKTPA